MAEDKEKIDAAPAEPAQTREDTVPDPRLRDVMPFSEIAPDPRLNCWLKESADLDLKKDEGLVSGQDPEEE